AGPGGPAGLRYRSGLSQGLRELGYTEGRDYAFAERFAHGSEEHLNSLADELAQLKVDVIVTGNTAATLAARRATTSIPIVAASLTDPVGLGLAASEARPGTNVTGILLRVEGLPGKQVQLAHELLPGATSIGALMNAANPSNPVQQRETHI